MRRFASRTTPKIPRVLIVGFGDIGERVARLLGPRYHISALVRTPARARRAHELAVQPVRGDLANPRSLEKLAGTADIVFHFAPPPANGATDVHTQNLLAALHRQSGRSGMLSQRPLRRIVYISTTGVYGDCAGARIDESRALRPATMRAKRRVDAETRLCRWGRRHGAAVSILRAPGIYSETRLPAERLRKGTPALVAEEDVFTNHIHAEDLARAAIAAMRYARPGRVYNVVDDSALAMGEYFDLVADAYALPRPARVTRKQAASMLSPMLLSFMSESRRIGNARVKRDLRLKLKFPTVADCLREFVRG